jgi:hypothetical protein
VGRARPGRYNERTVSSLLSAISGKFSSAVILGTFFPVTVFVFLARVLWVPLLPPGFRPSILVPLAGLDEKWELFVLTLVTIVFSGLLYNLNTPVLRIYEGYPWKETLFGRWKTGRYRKKLRALEAQKEGLYPLRKTIRAEGEAHQAAEPNDRHLPLLRSWIQGTRAQEDAVLRDLFALYPKERSVLPTRFGNAIRSFENYPERQYGMASIVLWPRLIAVIDPAYAEVIDGAKASLDFMVNSSLLSSLLALLLLATGLVYPAPFASTPALAGWLAEVAILAAVAWWLYAQSVGSAIDWGNLVRGAFDLYRGKLLEKLGYGYTPATAEEEKKLWRILSDRLETGDPPEDGWKIPPYSRPKAPGTSATAVSGANLAVTRGVVPMGPVADGGLRVILGLRNPTADPHAPALEKPTVTDTVPDGYSYLWGSESVSEGDVEVEGTNPYLFRATASLAPGAILRLEYSIVARLRSGS